jgi:hypothetical protein
MKSPSGAAAAGLLVAAILATLGSQPASDGAVAIAAAYGRNETLHDYTFHMDITMHMRHFPWLSFAMAGDGQYQRGDKYDVHFTSGPSFVTSKMHDIDLSLIDPTMWPQKYRYVEAGELNGDTVFSLEPIDDNSLKTATVGLNSTDGARWVDVTYSDGTHIHMTINTCDREGYLLPQSLSATVDYPHMPLTADAQFSAYSVSRP